MFATFFRNFGSGLVGALLVAYGVPVPVAAALTGMIAVGLVKLRDKLLS